MRKFNFYMIVLIAAAVFSGCETIKSTVAGPFVGLEKDVRNTSDFVGQHAVNISGIDKWIQENMW